jgi:hypothetical protein
MSNKLEVIWEKEVFAQFKAQVLSWHLLEAHNKIKKNFIHYNRPLGRVDEVRIDFRETVKLKMNFFQW